MNNRKRASKKAWDKFIAPHCITFKDIHAFDKLIEDRINLACKLRTIISGK
jgi:hypothetical protein